MTNLIPERRTDKNGRAVTRHVKPPHSASQVKKLPMPVISQKSREKLIEDTAIAVSSNWTNLSEATYFYEEAKTRFKDYAPETLHRIKSLQAENMNLLMNGILHQDWNEGILNDYVSLAGVAKRSHVYSQQLQLHMEGLTKYDLEPWQVGEPYPSKREQQCKAILETHLLINGLDEDDEMHLYIDFGDDDGGVLPYIKNDTLRNLIVHSADRDTAVSIMRERRTTDTEVILEVLGQDAPAISKGFL